MKDVWKIYTKCAEVSLVINVNPLENTLSTIFLMCFFSRFVKVHNWHDKEKGAILKSDWKCFKIHVLKKQTWLKWIRLSKSFQNHCIF